MWKLFAFGALLTAAVAVSAKSQDACQLRWQPRTLPGITNGLFVDDPAIGETIAASSMSSISSATTATAWPRRWSGSIWEQIAPRSFTGGIVVIGWSGCYDSKRGRVVTFGGSRDSGTVDSDAMYAWNGLDWKLIPASPVRPTGRSFAAMAYDSVRDRVVLFGGIDRVVGQVYLGDTWEYDGTNWSQVATSGPSARAEASLWFDTEHQRMILAGGRNNSATVVKDAWVFQDSVWVPLDPLPAFGDYDIGGGFDGSRNLLISGGEGWTLNSGWQPAFGKPPSELTGLFWPLHVSGRQSQAFVVGTASSRTGIEYQLWTHQGNLWNRAGQLAPSTWLYGAAFDPSLGAYVMYGGLQSDGRASGQEFQLIGNEWFPVAIVGQTPGLRSAFGMCEDVERNSVVVFGGRDGNGVRLADTWTRSGNAWTRHVVAGPSARSSCTIAYDAVRKRVVLFGGYTGSAYLADTWEWDGQSWTQKAIAGPAARGSAAMCFDPIRGKLILFGGSSTSVLKDTWEYDGSAWIQIAPTGPTTDRPALAFHPGAQAALLIGGKSVLGSMGVWKLVGATWVAVTSERSGASEQIGARAATDWTRGTVIVSPGGALFTSGPIALQPTYELVLRTPLTVSLPSSPMILRRGESRLIGARVPAGGSYQSEWHRDEVPLTDAVRPDGSELWGSDGSTLAFVRARDEDAGRLRFVLSDACFTAEAALDVVVTCSADLDRNMVVDDADFQIFVVAYDRVLCPVECSVDFNNDRIVDDADFVVFAADYNVVECASSRFKSP